jgi:hypothetical protein
VEPVSHGLFSLLTGKVQGIWLENDRQKRSCGYLSA